MVGCAKDEAALPAELSITVTDLSFDNDTDAIAIKVQNTGGSPLRWTSDTDDSWVSLSPSTGNIPAGGEASVNVSVNRNSLPSGFSFSEISLYMIGTGNITEGKVLAERTISVEVLTLLPPDLNTSTPSIALGSQTSSTGFDIQNSGDLDLVWSATSGQSWMTLIPSSGTTGGNQSTSVIVNVNRSGLAPGQYTGEIAITSNGGNATVTVTMDVNQATTKILYTRYTTLGTYTGYEIYTMNADGTQPTNLTNNAFYDSAPAWSPDFTKIAFESGRNGVVSIFTMNANGTQATQLTTGATSYDPRWSADGSKLVFSRNVPSGSEAYEIFTMNANGTSLTQLTFNSAKNYYPDWSPDGQYIVFSSDMDGDSEIYRMNSDGTNLIKLTSNTTSDALPSFSRTGDKIVYASNEDGDSEIYVININGTGKVKLTNNSVYDSYPSFSKTTDNIIFTSYRDGNDELYSMTITGTNVTRLTTTTTAGEIYGEF